MFDHLVKGLTQYASTSVPPDSHDPETRRGRRPVMR